MQFDDLARHYASLADGELLHLEKSSDDLLPQAASLLRHEIHRRRIPPEEPESPPSPFSPANSFSQTSADPFVPDTIGPSYIASPESIDQLSRTYQTKTDDEILILGSQVRDLTPEAHRALRDELARRGVEPPPAAEIVLDQRVEAAPRLGLAAQAHRAPLPVADFIAEVVRIHYGRFWLFFRLMTPAVLIGYLAFFFSRYEIREIERKLPHGVGLAHHPIAIFQIGVLNYSRFLISWLGFSFAFVYISSAVRQWKQDEGLPSQPKSGEFRARWGKFLQLSLLLFLMFAVLQALALFVLIGVWALARWQNIHLGGLTTSLMPYVLSTLAICIFSRFALAIPVFLWEHTTIVRSIFRSGELTEGEWLNLAVFLVKSLVAGYVAGMLPYWLAGWFLAGRMVPWWFDDALLIVSVAAVSAVEPMLFIGFAVLYEHRSAISLSTAEAVPALSAS